MALAIDGTPVTGSSANNTLASAAFTNSVSNAIIIAVISAAAGSGVVPTVSSISGGGLTWAMRKTMADRNLNYGFGAPTGVGTNDGDGNMLSIWWALAPTALTAQAITATLTNSTDSNITIFAVSGANTSTPWDANASLPATLLADTHVQATPTVGSVSTTNANTMLLAFIGGYFGNAAANFPLTVPTGFTQITSINTTPTFTGQQSSQQIISSAQSSITVAYGTQYTDFYYIVDAIQAAGAAAQPVAVGMPSGIIFVPGSGPTRQLRSVKAFPPTNIPIALSARASLASAALANIGTTLGTLAAQVGMPQGFLFRPGTGPTWDVKRRAAFPDTIAGNSVSLFARSFAAGFVRANANGAVPLAAKSMAAIKATDGVAGAVPLAAKSEAMVKATDGIAGAVPLAAKSEAIVKTVDHITGSLPLFGASVVSGHARAAFSGAVPLLAKTAIISTAKATLGLAANLIAVAGLIGAAVKARAGLTGSVSLLARSSLTTKASPGLSASVLLSAKSAITSSTRATITAAVALTAVAGRIGIAVKSRGAMTVNLALSATTAIRTATTAAIVAFGVHTVGRPLKNANTRVRTIYNTLRRNS